MLRARVGSRSGRGTGFGLWRTVVVRVLFVKETLGDVVLGEESQWSCPWKGSRGGDVCTPDQLCTSSLVGGAAALRVGPRRLLNAPAELGGHTIA